MPLCASQLWSNTPPPLKSLHEADPALHQPPRQQALPAEGLRFRMVHSVERLRGRRFLTQVHRFGRLALHPVSQFVRADARRRFLLARMRAQELLVELVDEARDSRCFSGGRSFGGFRFSTGSPALRNCTPWKFEGRNRRSSSSRRPRPASADRSSPRRRAGSGSRFPVHRSPRSRGPGRPLIVAPVAYGRPRACGCCSPISSSG